MQLVARKLPDHSPSNKIPSFAQDKDTRLKKSHFRFNVFIFIWIGGGLISIGRLWGVGLNS